MSNDMTDNKTETAINDLQERIGHMKENISDHYCPTEREETFKKDMLASFDEIIQSLKNMKKHYE